MKRNTIITHYQIRRSFVQRCERCAELHQIILACRTSVIVALAIPLLAILFMSVSLEAALAVLMIRRVGTLVFGFLFFLAYSLARGRRVEPGSLHELVRSIPRGVLRMLETIVAHRITPRGERRINDIKGSAGFKLISDAESIKILSSKDAVVR